ncbi:MAG TPA: tRNA (adenosine(37)-N6)-threonylcarbamoyltransferase complex dimerization subunit type 1 TsaB [Thermaerobacter sp.]
MGWILGLDTSGTWCGVALARDGRVVGEERIMEPGANRALMPAVDRLCREAGIRPRQLEGVAVAIGPGSFTGLRIGLAAAKGLALALDLPLAGIDSLEAAAATVAGVAGPGGAGVGAGGAAPGAPAAGGPLLVARRARRNEVYAAVYEPVAPGGGAGSTGAGVPPERPARAPRRLWGPEAVPPAELLRRLPEIAPQPLTAWWWMAAGDTGLWEALEAAGGGDGAGPRRLADPGPCAAAVCLLAMPRLAAGGDDPALLGPVYLPAVPGYRPYARGPAG